MNAEALIGTELGTCTLQKLLGQGGMGAVFLAQQSRPRRQVAVKVLLPISPLPHDQHAAFLERFRRETDVVASLEHPNIMPVHEYGERDGLAYLVMPYISGGTLRDEMERVGQLPLEQVVFYLEQMAAALEFAHERGVIHRDVKPANMLVRREGRLLLTDFGLVKIVSEEAGSRLTGVGVPVGTPDYMAPEQVIGAEIDMRADLYSLGVLLYQMVTGTLPFKGDAPMQVAMQHMQMPPPAPRSLRPTLPPAAEQVILRALAKRPQDRYMHVQEFASAFRLALIVSGVPLPDFSSILAPGVLTDLHIPTPYNLLAPTEQGSPTANGVIASGMMNTMNMRHQTRSAYNEPRKDIVGKTSMPMPSLTAFMAPNTPNPLAPNPPTPSMPAPNPATPSAPVRNTLHSYLRPGIGHKLNLQHPSDGAENLPEETQAQQQHIQDALLPQPPLQASPAPEGSGFSPSPKRFGLRPMLSLSSTTSEVPSTNLLGKSGLRPLSSMALGGSGVSSIPSDADLPPQQSFNSDNTAMPFFQPPPATEASSHFSQFNSLPTTPGGNAANTLSWPPNNSMAQPFNNAVVPLSGSKTTQQLGPPDAGSLTGALVMGNIGMSSSGNTSMMKLVQPTKVIQVPIAGQPGRYVTSLLPVLEEAKPGLPPLPPHIAHKVAMMDGLLKGHLKAAVLLVAIALVIFSSGTFLLIRSHSNTSTANSRTTMPTSIAGAAAAATASAVATASANVIVEDPLDGNGGNIHNMPIANGGPRIFMYKDNAYHITANTLSASALLPNVAIPSSFVYTLTMDAIKGDEGSDANTFGMIIRYSSVTKGGNKKVTTFYSLEAVNKQGDQYHFWKYDDSQGTDNNKAWNSLWQGDEGNEFHFGHGPKSKNVVNIIVSGSHFTFIVNGKKVGSAHDSSLNGNQVGMFVNLQGTEVAFSDLALTYN